MVLAQVPDVEPRGRDAARALHLHALAGVDEAQLRLVQCGVAPSQVAVEDVMELPALLRGEGDDLLDLLQGHERVVGPELLHPHRAELVEALDQPGAAALAAQRHDPRDDEVGLVDLVVLQVDAHEVQGNSQVLGLQQGGSELALWQLLGQVVRVRATTQGYLEDPVLQLVLLRLRFHGLLRLRCPGLLRLGRRRAARGCGAGLGSLLRLGRRRLILPLLRLLLLLLLLPALRLLARLQPRLCRPDELAGELPLQTRNQLRVARVAPVELDVAPNVPHHRFPLLQHVRGLHD
mmetsp:Transcript_66737/g.215049  ORF Transcript_66737/g.215049 Transcript_66737/m.215049 type:complete len:292 (+) Transcript_66737:1421-2296(+)